MEYSIHEHKHRFAAWAASHAILRGFKDFHVEIGKSLVEKVGLCEVAISVDYLPKQTEFDIKHREWRNNIIEEANKYQIHFTHGRAAKLIIDLRLANVTTDSPARLFLKVLKSLLVTLGT